MQSQQVFQSQQVVIVVVIVVEDVVEAVVRRGEVGQGLIVAVGHEDKRRENRVRIITTFKGILFLE